jgi:hypothetical protein
VKGCRARTRRNARSVNNALAIGQIDREDNCLPAANFADSVPCSTELADPMFRCAQPILPLLALLAVWSGAALAAQPGSIFLRYEVTGGPGLHFLTLQVNVDQSPERYSLAVANRHEQPSGAPLLDRVESIASRGYVLPRSLPPATKSRHLAEKSGSQQTRRWRELDSNPHGAFPVNSLFLVCCGFFVRRGKAVLRPVACDQVRGARGRGQGTETVAKLGGLAA